MTHSNSQPNTSTTMTWVLCFFTAFFYCFAYILRLLPGVLKDDLMLNYSVTAADFGHFVGIYYAGYALFHLPFGIMLERSGPKFTTALSIALCGLGILPPLYSDSWMLAVIGRFLLGAGSATSILSLLFVIRTYFPADKFSSIFGFCVSLGIMGGFFGSRPVGILNEHVGWQATIWIFILVVIALFLVFTILMPSKIVYQNTPKSSVMDDLKHLIKNRSMWAVAILSGLMMGPLEGFADAWGIPFFTNVINIDIANAQALPSIIFFGFAFGCPVVGYIGEKYQIPYTIMITSAIAMALIYVGLFIFKPNNLILLYALMFIVGMLCAYQVFMIFINTRIVPKHLAGLSSTFTNMVAMSFGTFFHSIIGSVMNWRWDGTIENQLPIYSSADYIYGLSIIPIGLIVGFCGFLYLKPKNQRELF